MARSQNATFHGAEPKPDGDRVRGASIVRLITTQLGADGWCVGNTDDWRDAGFILPIDRAGESLQLVLTQYHGPDNAWILQIAPFRFPHFLARWFGSTPSATAESILSLANDTHRILINSGFTNFRWCWDDLADNDCNSHPVPTSAA